VGLGGFHRTPVPRRAAIVLSYANVTEPAIARAMADLARHMRSSAA
jgi:hypothetical protein